MKFSVIVPIYNCIKELSACVESILRQTEPDFELLLVDDGSIDGSGALCDRFAEQDARIRVFHKENGGASSARNLGLNRAAGDYILFFDGDDTIEAELLEKVSSALSEASPQMVIFGISFEYLNSAGNLEKTEHLSMKHSGLVSSASVLNSFSEYYLDNALSGVWNKVFSGHILRENGLCFSEGMTLYEDLDFVLRYLPHCEEILFLDTALYHYRIPIQAPYTNKRMMNLNKMQHNLDLLIDSVLALNSQEAAQQMADRCAQLYDEHLMTILYSQKDLPQVISAIQGSYAIRNLSRAGFTPSPTASASWSLISNGTARELYFSLRKRRLASRTKQVLKSALKTVGLYHS